MRLRPCRRLSVVCVGGEQALLDQKFTRLKNWVIQNGGFVHDSLRLQKFDKPPYLTLRARYPVNLEEVQQPCIGLPSSIIIDRKTALGDLEDVLTQAGCPPLYARPTVDVLCIFIAHHRQQGEASIWHPAVSSLPEKPPCPWLRQIRDLEELEYDAELQETIQKERSGNDLIVKQLHALYGQFLGISRVELLWAYGHAQAVSIHEKGSSFWPPLANFIQHDRTQPPLYMHEQGRFVTWGWQDRPIAAGEHLKINIGIENPLLLYLSRGIVSENL